MLGLQREMELMSSRHKKPVEGSDGAGTPRTSRRPPQGSGPRGSGPRSSAPRQRRRSLEINDAEGIGPALMSEEGQG